MAALISVERMAKSYSRGGQPLKILCDLDFQVERGEFSAIMGASGSGKSTLLNILGCLDRHTAGRYLFDGRDMSGLDDEALSLFRSREVGFVFQGFNLVPQFSVLENVELPFLYAPDYCTDMRARCIEALARVGLAARLQHLPSELSGGEMQRVAIARAIVMLPRLILADEPTGNLDSATGGQILDILEELNRNGATVLVVTHDAGIAARAQRQLRLEDGRFA
jgi:putative ABC transport system ATP-binding protein